jgi:hypothetical protein
VLIRWRSSPAGSIGLLIVLIVCARPFPGLVGAGKAVGVTAFAVLARIRLLLNPAVNRNSLGIALIRFPIEVRVTHCLLLGRGDHKRRPPPDEIN